MTSKEMMDAFKKQALLANVPIAASVAVQSDVLSGKATEGLRSAAVL